MPTTEVGAVWGQRQRGGLGQKRLIVQGDGWAILLAHPRCRAFHDGNRNALGLSVSGRWVSV